MNAVLTDSIAGYGLQEELAGFIYIGQTTSGGAS